MHLGISCQGNMKTKVLIASVGETRLTSSHRGDLSAALAQLLYEEELLEEREVCGTLCSSLNPLAAARLSDAPVFMDKSQLHH